MDFVARVGLDQTTRTLRMLRRQDEWFQGNNFAYRRNQVNKPLLDSPMLSLIYATILLLMVSPLLVVLVIAFGPAFLVVCAAVSVTAGVAMVTLSICFVCFLTCLLCFKIFLVTVMTSLQAVRNATKQASCRIKDEFLYIMSIPSRLWQMFKLWVHDIFTQPFRNWDVHSRVLKNRTSGQFRRWPKVRRTITKALKSHHSNERSTDFHKPCNLDGFMPTICHLRWIFMKYLLEHYRSHLEFGRFRADFVTTKHD